MSIAMAFAWFGQFFSPLFFASASSLTGLDTSNMFLFASILYHHIGCRFSSGQFPKKPAEPDQG